MIDPTNITNYDMTQAELEEFLLFAISVAGKTAKQIAIALEKFLTDKSFYEITRDVYFGFGDVGQETEYADMSMSPFEKIRWLINKEQLKYAIINSKLGQHSKLDHAFREVVNKNLDLRTVTTEELEKIKGIGPKTSRFFILHSQKNSQIACLDTHILHWLKERGYKIPANPPSGKKYLEIEKIFLSIAKKMKKDPATLDLEIWNALSKRSGLNTKEKELAKNH